MAFRGWRGSSTGASLRKSSTASPSPSWSSDKRTYQKRTGFLWFCGDEAKVWPHWNTALLCRARQPTNRPTCSGDSPLLGRDDFEPTRTPIEHCVTHVHLMSQLRVPGIDDICGEL